MQVSKRLSDAPKVKYYMHKRVRHRARNACAPYVFAHARTHRCRTSARFLTHTLKVERTLNEYPGFHRKVLERSTGYSITVMLESGGQGGHWPPQYLAHQLTLFETGRADYPHLLLLAPPQCFSPSGITVTFHCLNKLF